MDTISAPQIGEILEQGQQSAVAVANSVKSAISDSADSASVQIGLKNEAGSASMAQTQNQSLRQEPSTGNSEQNSELTREIVGDFYAPSNDNNTPNPQSQEEYETQSKLQKVRQELEEHHKKSYYDPLIQKIYEQKKEERPAEAAEREEQQKMQDLAQKEEKSLPSLAVQRAQTHTEANPGVAG